jgi:O-antigen ligase
MSHTYLITNLVMLIVGLITLLISSLVETFRTVTPNAIFFIWVVTCTALIFIIPLKIFYPKK